MFGLRRIKDLNLQLTELELELQSLEEDNKTLRDAIRDLINENNSQRAEIGILQESLELQKEIKEGYRNKYEKVMKTLDELVNNGN